MIKIVTSLKWVWLSHQTTAFLMSRHVLLCIVLAFWHPSVLFLLPFLWIYDALIRDYLLNVFIYRQYLRQLEDDITETTPYVGELGLIENIVLESTKYELNQQLKAYSLWRKREKKIFLLQYTNLTKMAPTSYNSVADYNIIVVPFNFDPNGIQHAVIVAHEYSHAMGHDGYKLEKYSMLLTCLGTIALLICYSLTTNPNWIVVGLGCIAVVFLLVCNVINTEYDKELDADIGAVRYFENMDALGSFQVPTRKGRTVLQEVAFDIAYTRNNAKYIKPLWPFLRDEDKTKILKMNPQMAPNKWKFNYSSTEEIYMVMYDKYAALALLIVFISSVICCIKLLNYVVIPWYYLFFAIIPYVLLTLSIIKSNKLWKVKQKLLKKIGCE